MSDKQTPSTSSLWILSSLLSWWKYYHRFYLSRITNASCSKCLYGSQTISVYTDGSAHKLGVGTGLFIRTENDSVALFTQKKKFQSITLLIQPFSKLNVSGISVAAMRLSSTTNQNIAIITDSQFSIQTLQNPVVRNITKYKCSNQSNTLAGSN